MGRSGSTPCARPLCATVHAAHAAADILHAVYDDLKGFTYGVKQEDDISLVIVKARPAALPREDWSI